MKNVTIKNNLDDVLRKDPIMEMENVFGKHHSQFTDEENQMAMFHAMITNKSKTSYLNSLGDTSFSTKWDEFISIIKSYGFVEGLRYDFEHDNGKYIDEAALFYHPENGLIIWSTSYWNKDSVNGGKLYGQIKLNGVKSNMVKTEWGETKKLDIEEDEYKKIFSALNRCSYGALCDLDIGVDFSLDIREGLINKLEQIGSLLDFMPKWNKKQFLWFLDYTEEKQPGYDYEAITQEKINKCPKEVQNILEVCMR